MSGGPEEARQIADRIKRRRQEDDDVRRWLAIQREADRARPWHWFAWWWWGAVWFAIGWGVGRW